MKHTYLISWSCLFDHGRRQCVGHDVFRQKHKLKALDIPIIQKGIKERSAKTLCGNPVILNVYELAHEKDGDK